MPCNRLQEIDLAEFAVDPRAPGWAGFREHYPRCPDCSREVARFATLKQALAREGVGSGAHLSEAQLVSLGASPDQLASEERARLEAHLAGCAPCRTELAVVRSFDPSALEPAATGTSRRGGGGGALVLRLRRPLLAAAAVVALAVPASVLVWRRARGTSALPGPPPAELERSAPVAGAASAPPEAAAASEAPPAPSLAVREEPPFAPAPPTRPEPVLVAKQPPVATERPVAKQPPVATERPVAKQPLTAKEQPVAKESSVATEAPVAKESTVAKQPPVGKQAPKLEAPEASPPALPRPIEIAALLPSESPRYSPGPLAEGPSLRIGGAARSLGAGAPVPEALGPAHVGASSHESPKLYWFLPEPTSSSLEVTVVDPGAEAPLLETTLPGPHAAGVHRVSLSEHGVQLRPGVDYRWFVALVRDPERRSQDVVSGAAIRYTPPGPELAARLSAAPPPRAAHLYAESGLWYDAFDQLSSWLALEPGAALLHDHRAALLEQVGLGDAAAFERRSSPGER